MMEHHANQIARAIEPNIERNSLLAKFKAKTFRSSECGPRPAGAAMGSADKK
jgi:hypothetical protein